MEVCFFHNKIGGEINHNHGQKSYQQGEDQAAIVERNDLNYVRRYLLKIARERMRINDFFNHYVVDWKKIVLNCFGGMFFP